MNNTIYSIISTVTTNQSSLISIVGYNSNLFINNTIVYFGNGSATSIWTASSNNTSFGGYYTGVSTSKIFYTNCYFYLNYSLVGIYNFTGFLVNKFNSGNLTLNNSLING